MFQVTCARIVRVRLCARCGSVAQAQVIDLSGPGYDRAGDGDEDGRVIGARRSGITVGQGSAGMTVARGGRVRCSNRLGV